MTNKLHQNGGRYKITKFSTNTITQLILASLFIIQISSAQSISPSSSSPSITGTTTNTSPSSSQYDTNCIQLINSTICSAFNGMSLNLNDLSSSYPFFSSVKDSKSFDSAANNYFSDPSQFSTLKFSNQLGCQSTESSTSNLVIQWQRTVMCSKWLNSPSSSSCNPSSQQQQQPQQPQPTKMICQGACQQFALSELQIVNSTSMCPGRSDQALATREQTLTQDYITCTNWTSTVTANLDTCVQGFQNEKNCGFDNSLSQLCDFCNPTKHNLIDSCCVRSNTDLSSCDFKSSSINNTISGYLPFTIGQPHDNSDQIASTQAISNPSKPISTTANQLSDPVEINDGGLSAGAIAGIVIGSLVAVIVFALLVYVVYICKSRKRSQQLENGFVNEPQSYKEYPYTNVSNVAPNDSSQPISQSTQQVSPQDDLPKLSILSQDNIGTSTQPETAPALVSSGANLEPDNSKALDQSEEQAGIEESGSSSTLDRYLDSNSNGKEYIYPGSSVYVLYPYQPNREDELTLQPDTQVTIIKIYDDDWGFGTTVDGLTGDLKEGVFPLVCVTATPISRSVSYANPSLISKRSSRKSVSSRTSSKRSGR